MRLATHQETLQIVNVYNEALAHAQNVGHIDWPQPFPIEEVTSMIEQGALHYFDIEGTYTAAIKLTDIPDNRIWGQSTVSSLYFSRLATSNTVRGKRYVQTDILPQLIRHAISKRSIRADCLADNAKLQQYYHHLGFMSLGNSTFYSDRQHKDVTVTKLEFNL